MHRISLFMLVIMVFLLVGCGGQDDTPVLPTIAELNTEPQVETEEATAEEVAPTQASTTRPTTVRATLPPIPTQTPPPTPTDIPASVDTATPIPPALPPVQPLTVCDTFQFGPVLTTEFRLGTEPTVSWTAVEGAVSYRVRLFNIQSPTIELTPPIFIGETSYTFESFLFETGNEYGWEVYPIDSRNQQMCIQIGEGLIPIG